MGIINVIIRENLDQISAESEKKRNTLFVLRNNDITVFDGYLGLIIAKLFTILSTGFIVQTELQELDNNCLLLDLNTEQEHFNEDLLKLLIQRETIRLVNLSTSDLDLISNHIAKCSYQEFMREHGNHTHSNSECTYIQLKDSIIYRGDPSHIQNDDGFTIIDFDTWYSGISYNDLSTLWSHEKYRLLIKFLRRHPGGNHEWIMCSHTLTAKKFDIPAQYLNDLVTPTNICKIICDGVSGWHGGTGSTQMHNALSERCNNAKGVHEFIAGIRDIINTYLVDANKQGLLSMLDQLNASFPQ